MSLHLDYIGIDIAKAHLDVFDPKAGHLRLANTAAAIAGWTATLAGRSVFVVLEATGHYDSALRHGLHAADLAHARINPMQARRFAEATGRLAKTDRIDAAMLAELGRCLKPTTRPVRSQARDTLAGLHKRRDQLVQQRAAETVRLGETAGLPEAVRANLIAHLDWLKAAIKALQDEIDALIQNETELAGQARLMTSTPGIGPVTATTLLALMPELGQRSSGTIAALAGLAPFNCDSGLHKGVRRIRGGRPRVRRALYMAALAAARANTRYRAVFNRLVNAGKPKKLALITVARKLLVTLNAMLRDQKPYAP